MNRSDNFNRTVNVALGGATPSDSGSAWVDVGTDFTTNTDGGTGEVVAYCSANNSQLAYLEASATDQEVAAEIVNISGAAQSGVATRITDSSNYYYFYSDSSGTTYLYKNVGGSFTLLDTGTETFTAGVGNFLSIRAVGTTITGYVNSVQSAQATDSSLTTGTKGGIRCSSNAFTPYYNSFSITDLTAAGGTAYSYWAWNTFGNPLHHGA